MNVVVCGTNYGSTYIRALALANDGVRLKGILSKGSQRSQRMAKALAVPHYQSTAELPDGLDIACVAVAGEAGFNIASELLQKGLHVIIEHPLGEAQAAPLLQCAEACDRHLFINAHFGDLQASALFLQSFHKAAGQYPLLHLSIDANLRTIYSALDIAGRIWGSLDHFEVVPLRPADQTTPVMFEMLGLRSGSFMAHLLVQNYSSPRDDGSATLLNHRISASFPHGNLLLAETTGPVLWYPTITSMPNDSWNSYLPIDMSNNTLNSLQTQRDTANLQVVYSMIKAIKENQKPTEQQTAYLVSLVRLWDQVLFNLSQNTETQA